jgi:type II secretory pathway pseudopilin PulG
MRNARNQDGFALVAAIIILTVMMGLGLGLLLLTDNQQKASAREQASESAFNVAEAALNAQIGQLSRNWPSTKAIGEEYPSRCTEATSTATNGCPDAGSLKIGYPNISPVPCAAGAATEAWGSPLTNEWTTYVRDDVGESPYFNSTTENEAATPTWAEHGKVWVRAVGVVQCRIMTLVSLVAPQYVTLPFPSAAVVGNWFETSNTGNKVIVDNKGEAGSAGAIKMRCNGYTGTEKEIKKECVKEKREGQVSPGPTEVGPAPPALSAGQLEGLKKAAKVAGTYFPAGPCPENISGKPVYIEGPCNLSFNGGTVNSEASPGFLVIVNGTFKMNGNANFFGTLYAVNAQNSSGIVVELHGNGTFKGSIDVDGNGGISFGSNKENFIYSDRAAEELKTFAGASGTRNSFRVLPVGK